MADNIVYLKGSYVKDTDVTQALGHLDSSTSAGRATRPLP